MRAAEIVVVVFMLAPMSHRSLNLYYQIPTTMDIQNKVSGESYETLIQGEPMAKAQTEQGKNILPMKK